LLKFLSIPLQRTCLKTEEIYMELFDFSRPTYFKRKREHNKALLLVQKYFSEKEILEFIQTGSIQRLEQQNSSKSGIEEHILFHAIQKIIDIPNQPIWGKKGFWLKGFLDALQLTEAKSKSDFLENIKILETKWWEAENWKNLTINFINNNFSEYEIQLILKNKVEVMQKLTA